MAPSGVNRPMTKKVVRKTIDFGIVSVATVIKLDNNIVKNARIVLGGVSSRPYRAILAEQTLIGESITQEAAAKAAEASVIETKPKDKNSFKIPVLKALIRRAILQ